MLVINILGHLFLCLFLAWHYKEKLITVLPCGMGILMVLLFMLSFFDGLNMIDYINIGIIVFGFITIVKKKDMLQYFKDEISSPSSIVMFIVYLLIFVSVKDRMAADWDELGVWALEVKSIYYIGGFADKFKFAAIGFADYFPGQMLLEWWTCHFMPRDFNEGLMYVGYYWAYVTFLMPFIKYLDLGKKNVVPIGVAVSILYLLLPGITGVFGYRFLSAELLVSVAFASCLFQYIDFHRHELCFSVLNLTLTVMQLILFKETGMLYALLALIFGCIIFNMKKRRNLSENPGIKGYAVIITCSLVAGIPAAIWKAYCKIMERGKYFDSTAKNLISGLDDHSYQIDENASLYVQRFFQSLFQEPLHEDITFLVDMTVFMCILLIMGLVYYAYRKKYIEKREYRTVWLYYMGAAIPSFAALICMHVFIFREEQYLETAKMIKSISRYLEPLFLGFIIFIFYFLVSCETKRPEKLKNIILCAGIILLCTNYKFAYNSIVNYRPSLPGIQADRDNAVKRYERLYRDIERMGPDRYGRTLYLEASRDTRAEKKFRYLAAPFSIIFKDISADSDGSRFKDIVRYYVTENHCDYIFFNGIGQEYLDAVFGADSNCLADTLISVRVNEFGNITFGNA